MTRLLPLTRLTASEAQALTTIAQRGAQLELSAWKWGQPPHLALSVLPPGYEIDAVSWQRLELDWAGAKLTLDLPRSAALSWVTEVLGTSDVASLAPEWEQAAWLQACDWLAQSLTQAGRGKARIQQLAAVAAAQPVAARHRFLCSLHFAAHHAQPPQVIHAILHADSLGLLLLSGFVASHGQVLALQTTPSLPIVLQLALGETDLPLQQLQTLQQGDVVFFSRLLTTDRHHLTLCHWSADLPSWGVLARLDGRSLHILQAPTTMAPTESATHPDDTESSRTEVSLGQIPVRLSFDLGSTTVTLEALQSMQAGQVLNLERPLQDYVTIRANGAAVGKGQLVELDGRLGVMVASLSLAQSEQP